jgi:UDP-N-acetylmuramoylalanine--D-glutamate ligase
MTDVLSGRRVVVAGIAVSGIAAADALLDRGADVLVVDGRDGEQERQAAERLRARGAEVRLGDAQSPVQGDLVVASPGWRPDQPLLAEAQAAGIEVIGEPELAWRLRDPTVPWLGVTGTNGKTTTVGMLEAVLRADGRRTVAAGNVGLPLVTAVGSREYDVLAVEISSQQLVWSPSLRFAAAAVLNIGADHLDWHDTLSAYRDAKARIWIDAVAVGNADDPEVRSILPADGRAFSLQDESADYVATDGVLTETRGAGALLAIDELQVVGPHNVANALAATALARAADAGVDAVRAGLLSYRPGNHRNTVVGVHDGVTFVDDSKATNPHAVAASLSAYASVVWIAGGLLKGVDVDPVVAAHAHRLRGVVLLGRDRFDIAEALARHAPHIPVVDVASTDTGAMSEAVRAAAALAAPGDVVLLAPAGASWDMFRDYADRGDRFAAAVRDEVVGA